MWQDSGRYEWPLLQVPGEQTTAPATQTAERYSMEDKLRRSGDLIQMLVWLVGAESKRARELAHENDDLRHELEMLRIDMDELRQGKDARTL